MYLFYNFKRIESKPPAIANCGRIKKLTTEGAEPAEVNTAKGSRPACKGKRGLISKAFRKAKTRKSPSKKNLCALCFLFGQAPIFIRGGCRERKIFIPKRRKAPQTAESQEDAERMKYS